MPGKIPILEDDSDTTALMNILLQQEGYKTVTAIPVKYLKIFKTSILT